MTWRAALKGHEFDLDTLTQLFVEGDPLVGDDAGEGHYLESAVLDGPGGQPDHAAAEALMKQVNGIARALDGGYQPVALTSRYTDPNGNASVIFGVGAAHGRSRVTASGMVINGQPVAPQPPKGPRYAALAAKDPDVADALRILGQPDNLDWYDLYKAYEIVEHNSGGSATIVANGWAAKSDLKRLTISANHPGISGDLARHARRPGSAPRSNRVMTLHDADALVRRLVSAWIEAHPDY
jgi:hypothetical protein